jgi:hypothetical protein
MAELYSYALEEWATARPGNIGPEAVVLGRLAQDGLPVVPGFCLPAAAYRRHVAQSGVARALDATHRPLAQITRSEGNPHEPTALLDRLRRRIEHAPLPPAVDEALDTAYRALIGTDADADAARPVALRLVPLGPAASEADPLRLDDIRGRDALADAVRACWAGLWSDTALARRTEHEQPPASVACAVLVQAIGPEAGHGRLILDGTDPAPIHVDSGPALTADQEEVLRAWGSQVVALGGPPLALGWVTEGEALGIAAVSALPLPRRPARRPRLRRFRLRREVGLALMGGALLALARRLRPRRRRKKPPLDSA